MLERIKTVLGRFAGHQPPVPAGVESEYQELIARIRSAHLTYLSERKMGMLASTCREIESAGLPGMMIEAGCALGGSAILMASIKASDRPFRVYDVFGMIPPPTAEDTKDVHERYRTIVEGKAKGIERDKYYGYEQDLYEKVKSNLESFGIDCSQRSLSLIKGLLQDTMHVDGPVAMAHVDVDWYEPVKTCLQRIWPRLVAGGSIILNDYRDWGGCRKAADEYLEGIEGQFSVDDSAGSRKITRVAR